MRPLYKTVEVDERDFDDAVESALLRGYRPVSSSRVGSRIELLLELETVARADVTFTVELAAVEDDAATAATDPATVAVARAALAVVNLRAALRRDRLVAAVDVYVATAGPPTSLSGRLLLATTPQDAGAVLDEDEARYLLDASLRNESLHYRDLGVLVSAR